MTVTASYSSDYGRVRLAISAAPSDADLALVERSTDGITWTSVRGGDAVPLTSGSGQLDDFEFDAAIPNTYRVSYVDLAAPAVYAAGTAVTGNNTSVTPPLPAGVLTGDLLVIAASIRNSGTGAVDTAALNALGWYTVSTFGNVAFVAKRYTAGVTAPVVNFTGGAVNEDTIAQMVGIRNAADFPTASASFLGPSQQNIGYPNLTVVSPQSVALYLFWKQDDWTSLSPGSSFPAGIATAGNDAAQALYVITSATPGVTPGATVVVTGGAAAISRVLVASFPRRPNIGQDTVAITPVIGSYWFKIPARPGANHTMEVTLVSEITRRARVGMFDVLRRTMPVAITDVQSSRAFTIEIDVKGYPEMKDWDNRLASGDPFFIQAPDQGGFVPTLYGVTGDVSYRQDTPGCDSITFVVPVTEVARPGMSVYGNSYIWNDVITQYATWSDVIAAKTTWSNLLDTVSNSVIVVS